MLRKWHPQGVPLKDVPVNDVAAPLVGAKKSASSSIPMALYNVTFRSIFVDTVLMIDGYVFVAAPLVGAMYA